MRLSPTTSRPSVGIKEMDTIRPTPTRATDAFRGYERGGAVGASPGDTEGSISDESLGTSSGNTLNSVNGSVLSGGNVPEKNKVVMERIRMGLDTRTTIMIKNVPNKYTQVFPPRDKLEDLTDSKCLWSMLISRIRGLMISCIFALIFKIDAS